MKFKSALNKFLTNKIVLNVVAVLALLNVIGYVVMEKYNSVLFFVVLALLVTYFSKNMIIVLGIPLIFVNLLNSNKKIFIEGMENKEDTTLKTATHTTTAATTAAPNKKIIAKMAQQDAKSKQGLPITPLDSTNTTKNTAESNFNTDESFEVGRGKKGGSQIDYAATVEDAYDSLNKILGSDGIKRLTKDTTHLMRQQKELAESMKSMGPLIQSMAPMMEQAKDLLGGMGNNKEGLGGIMDIATKLSGSLGAPKK
jgi:hypothetical protein